MRRLLETLEVDELIGYLSGRVNGRVVKTVVPHPGGNRLIVYLDILYTEDAERGIPQEVIDAPE